MASSVLDGRYVLGRELGSGGFATVYEARDLKLGREVAVKLVPPAYRGQVEICLRLEREGRIAGALTHPNVCAVTDMGRLDEGTPFIVLERLHGETLAERRARGPVGPDLALDVVTQLLCGLGAAHAAGVVHRDVKPANLFLVELGGGRRLVKLLDFGLAQVPGFADLDGSALTANGVVVGTASYMSPEQVRGVRDLDARSDVYSSAVLAYELFAGARPFDDVPRHELFDAIAHKKAPSLAARAPSAPPAVVRAVDAALNVNRAHRPPDAQALLDRLTGAPELSLPGAPRAGAPRIAHAAPSPDEWDVPTWQGPPPRGPR